MSSSRNKKKRRHHPHAHGSAQAPRGRATESGGQTKAATRPKVQAPGTRHPKARKTRSRRRRGRFDPSYGQLAVVGAIVVIGGLFLLSSSRDATGGDVANPTAAPAFAMPSTAGGEVSLGGLAGRNVLLYFNEGVGCDACFYQTVELERAADEMADKGITFLPIVMNPIDDVRSELLRFQISTPYLIDEDGSVSDAYGVLGNGMHANLPGHGFVFIDATGQIRWQKEYPSMYASAGEVLGAVSTYTG